MKRVLLSAIMIAGAFTLFAEDACIDKQSCNVPEQKTPAAAPAAVPAYPALINDKKYKDDDLAAVTELQTDLAVGEEVEFDLCVFARKNTQWMVMENTVNTFCRVKMERDADDDDGTNPYPLNKLEVELKGRKPGTGKMVFLGGDKKFILHVNVR